MSNIDPLTIEAVAQIINNATLFVKIPAVGGSAVAQATVGRPEARRLAETILRGMQDAGLSAPAQDPVIAFPDWISTLPVQWKNAVEAVINAAIEANKGQ